MWRTFNPKEIEQIAVAYHTSTKAVEREKLLKRAFYLYEPLIMKYSFHYSKVSSMVGAEDIESLVKTGIWEALKNYTPGAPIRQLIALRVKFHVSKQMQILTSKKSLATDTKAERIDEDSNLAYTVKTDTIWMFQQDLLQAIEKLPARIQTIFKLWVDDVHYLDICKQMDLKDAQVYNYINEGKKLVQMYLKDYMADLT